MNSRPAIALGNYEQEYLEAVGGFLGDVPKPLRRTMLT